MSEEIPEHESSGVSRRSFLKTVGGVSAVLPATGLMGSGTAFAEEADKPAGPQVFKGTIPIKLKVNGQEKELKVETRTTLLDALRNHLDLTGSKLACDRGTCGACTVLMGGKTVTSCLVLAVDAQGQEITTIEGLAKGNDLHPVQAAFVEFDALQCGFCTPGFIMSCKAVLDEKPKASLDDLKEGLAGNICRCGTYNHIFKAAAKVQTQLSGATKITTDLAPVTHAVREA